MKEYAQGTKNTFMSITDIFCSLASQEVDVRDCHKYLEYVDFFLLLSLESRFSPIDQSFGSSKGAARRLILSINE